MIDERLLKKLKKVAERAIRNSSYAFEQDAMEYALTVMNKATQIDHDEDNTYANANAIRILMFKDFDYLSPLEQVTTLIHEFIHTYLAFKSEKNHAHDGLFLGLYRTVIRNTYPHVLSGTTHFSIAGGFRYALLAGNADQKFVVVCPKCKKPVTVNRDDATCPFCGYVFN